MIANFEDGHEYSKYFVATQQEGASRPGSISEGILPGAERTRLRLRRFARAVGSRACTAGETGGLDAGLTAVWLSRRRRA